MFDMIRTTDPFDNEECRFYIGSLILCLEYLHSQKIIYRDLKPENMIIDEQGYIHLRDSYTMKMLKNRKKRTNTLIGTPHYMAPEMVQGLGYSQYIDLWALGACLYEFMVGEVPFGEEEEDPYNVYKLIMQENVEFPEFFDLAENNNVKSFMLKMLSKIPEVRLNGSFASLKSHSWFEDFQWGRLMDKRIQAPYVPPQKMVSKEEIAQAIKTNKNIKEHLLDTYFKQKVGEIEDWEQEF